MSLLRLQNLWEQTLEEGPDTERFISLLRILDQLSCEDPLAQRSLSEIMGATLLQQPSSKRILPLQDIDTLDTTTRVDGIVPITIPTRLRPQDLLQDLQHSLFRLGIPTPADCTGLLEPLTMTWISLLHGLPLQLRYGLNATLRARCPHATHLGTQPEIVLTGELPLGGHFTLLKTPWSLEKHSDIAPSSLEHCSGLTYHQGQLTEHAQEAWKT